MDDDAMGAAITATLGIYAKTAHVHDVRTLVKYKTNSPDPFLTLPDLIPAKNGDLRIYYHKESRSWNLEETSFDSETYLKNRIATGFDHERYYRDDRANDCRQFLTFLNDIFRDDEDKADKIKLIQQWFGYCLLSSARFPMVMFLVGQGANGKSTLLKILEAMMGRSNTASVSLRRMGERFGLVNLEGKMVNIVEEVSAGTVMDDGVVKLLADCAPMDIERKGVDAVQVRLPAKHIFASNHTPSCRDVSRRSIRHCRSMY
jgi:P4 family phage/plasmid primase-like protien